MSRFRAILISVVILAGLVFLFPEPARELGARAAVSVRDLAEQLGSFASRRLELLLAGR